jgi:hypothetical protein
MAWLALVPFVAFALAFLVGLVFLLWFAKRLKITETQTKAGQASRYLGHAAGRKARRPAGEHPRLSWLPA